ncbi:MAG: vWA domain-containing protein [Polyangiaceae bacterium]
MGRATGVRMLPLCSCSRLSLRWAGLCVLWFGFAACTAAEQAEVDPGGSGCGVACVDAGALPDTGMAPPGRPLLGDDVRWRTPATDAGAHDAGGVEVDASADASGDGGAECDPNLLCATGELTAHAPKVMLLVDRSGSMTYPFASGLSRWEALTQVLAAPQTGVVSQFAGVEFGLVFYTYRGAATASCDVLSQVFQADFEQAFQAHPPILDGQTPTAEALGQVAQLLRPAGSAGAAASPTDAAGSAGADYKAPPSAIVLATDGMPDSCLEQKVDTEGSAAAQRAVAASVVAQVSALFVEGIPTYVVGVGSQLQRGHLQQLANAGVGYDEAARVGQPGRVFQAGDSAALRAAFDDHVSTLQSCGFDLDHSVSDPSRAEVSLDGRPLEWGTDWLLQTPERVVLTGSACDTLKGSGGTVRAIVPCGCAQEVRGDE